ncbi:hypothetical protein ACFSO0_06330 [Brevibacillus sp. GCM10020057]|uniref:hypothetical protein n=1 Tax=Brevibacillus sp. GCM10020057 TaxID=3317327 RepID=UPI0036447CEE
MKKWRQKVAASLFLLSLAIPASVYADNSSGTDDVHGYEDEPFQKYLAELIDSLDDTDYGSFLSDAEIARFSEENEDDGSGRSDLRERVYAWIIRHVDGPKGN